MTAALESVGVRLVVAWPEVIQAWRSWESSRDWEDGAKFGGGEEDDREPVNGGVVVFGAGWRSAWFLEGKSWRRRVGIPAFMVQWAETRDSREGGRGRESRGRRRKRSQGEGGWRSSLTERVVGVIIQRMALATMMGWRVEERRASRKLGIVVGGVRETRWSLQIGIVRQAVLT